MPDKAVLFGVNRYKSMSHLRGCLNDVQDIAAALTDVCGFAAANVRTRTDDMVTKKEVRKQWKWLLEDAAGGDRLVFHFSGHGSYATDVDGDEDDGVDELLCHYDMDSSDAGTYLLGDDLRAMTAEIPAGVHVTFLFDSCHSGTATRALRMPGQPPRTRKPCGPWSTCRRPSPACRLLRPPAALLAQQPPLTSDALSRRNRRPTLAALCWPASCRPRRMWPGAFVAAACAGRSSRCGKTAR